MVALTSPTNINEIFNQMSNQGLTPPTLEFVKTTKSKVDLVKKKFEIWNDPNNESHDEDELIDASVTPDFFSTVTDALRSSVTILRDLEIHLEGRINTSPGDIASIGIINFTKNMGIVSAEINRRDTLVDVGGSDTVQDEVFHLLTGGMQDELTLISDAIDVISSHLSDIDTVILNFGSITTESDSIQENADFIRNQISKELGSLSQIMTDIINFNQSLVISSLYKEPAFQNTIELLASPELVEELKLN